MSEFKSGAGAYFGTVSQYSILVRAWLALGLEDTAISGMTHHGRTSQLEDMSWEDTAIGGHTIGGHTIGRHSNWRTDRGRIWQEDTATGGHTMGGHSNWRTCRWKTQQLEDTPLEYTKIVGQTMGGQSN